MSKFLKRLLLVVPMVALFALSSTEQQANTKNLRTVANSNSDISKNDFSNSNKGKEKEGEAKAFTGGFVEDYCDQSEVIYIPPVFGFAGLVIAFGTGCGENSDQNCVSAASVSGGKFTFHVQCDQAEDEEDAN